MPYYYRLVPLNIKGNYWIQGINNKKIYGTVYFENDKVNWVSREWPTKTITSYDYAEVLHAALESVFGADNPNGITLTVKTSTQKNPDTSIGEIYFVQGRKTINIKFYETEHGRNADITEQLN